MPVLDNQRHEAFAQHLAKGMSADEAYQRAGYKQNRGNAIRMKANERIMKRVDELTQSISETVIDQTAITRSWVLGKLHSIATKQEEKAPAAANRALELIGKELGMFVERSENVNHNYGVTDEPASEDEWTERYSKAH